MFAGRLRSLFCRRKPLLTIERRLWEDLLAELSERGAGERESGAFLLGLAPVNGQPRCVVDVVYFDELDPMSLTGGISFSGTAYGKLWDECAARDLEVVADVHTHPGRWVGQSEIDRAHPMLVRSQHVALIVPDFAQRIVAAREVGVHEYLGDGRWRSSLGTEAAERFRIERRRVWP